MRDLRKVHADRGEEGERAEVSACPDCGKSEGRQHELTNEQREKIGVGTSSMRKAHRCSYCGCVHSGATNSRSVIHGWLDSPVLGSGWKAKR